MQDSDGSADQILIAAGTFTETGAFEPSGGTPGTYQPHGSDPLTIVGAGPGATILTSAGTGNIFLFNLDANNSRSITMRDLTARIPASFDDGLGSAFQLRGDTLDNVDIVSLNEGSNGVASTVGLGNVFRNGELRGEGANGAIDDGFNASVPGSTLLVEDATVKGASWPLISSGGSLTARRVSVLGARTYGAVATKGSLTVENSVITIDDGIGLYASAADDDAALNANHVTIVNSGGSDPAIEVKKFGPSAGNAAIVASNSILRGFASGYNAETFLGPGIGLVSIKARYSNLPSTGSGMGVIDFSTGNIDADPLFAADHSLPLGSPSIDAGDPARGVDPSFPVRR